MARTPLFETHRSLNAKIVDFAGWEMPLQYSSLSEEHRAVRSAAGLFDVSHMGEFEISGTDAQAFIQFIATNDASRLKTGDLQYSILLNDQGGTIDDIMVYRLGEQRYLVVGNAANIEKDWNQISCRIAAFEGVEVHNRCDEYALLAFQGPKAELVLSGLTSIDLSKLRFHQILSGEVAGYPAMIATSGYTGENGFEIFISPEYCAKLWETILEVGETHGVLPIGLGARDTLRLEASLPLYGHELDEDTSPLEAGLGVFVAKADGYIGSDVMRRQRDGGLRRKLVMIEMRERGIPRQDYEVQTDSGESIGRVTSGTFGPWLNKGIAMAYVSPQYTKVSQPLRVLIRDRPCEALVARRPFYKRPQR